MSTILPFLGAGVLFTGSRLSSDEPVDVLLLTFYAVLGSSCFSVFLIPGLFFYILSFIFLPTFSNSWSILVPYLALVYKNISALYFFAICAPSSKLTYL